MALGGAIILDNADVTNEKRGRRARRNFRAQITILIIYDIVLLILAGFILIFWWGLPYYWGIFLKILHVLRISLILVVAMADIDPLCIIGTGKTWKLIKFFSYYNHLGIWLVVGWIDLVLTRIPLLILDPIILAISGHFLSLRLILSILLDCFLVAEIPISIYLVYTIGVRLNVYRTYVIRNAAAAAAKKGRLRAR